MPSLSAPGLCLITKGDCFFALTSLNYSHTSIKQFGVEKLGLVMGGDVDIFPEGYSIFCSLVTS